MYQIHLSVLAHLVILVILEYQLPLSAQMDLEDPVGPVNQFLLSDQVFQGFHLDPLGQVHHVALDFQEYLIHLFVLVAQTDL